MADDPRQARAVRRFRWRLAIFAGLALGLPAGGLWWFLALERFYTDYATIRQVAAEAHSEPWPL